MREGVKYTGVPSPEELAGIPGIAIGRFPRMTPKRIPIKSAITFGRSSDFV